MVMMFARGVALRLLAGPAASSPEGEVRGCEGIGWGGEVRTLSFTFTFVSLF